MTAIAETATARSAGVIQRLPPWSDSLTEHHPSHRAHLRKLATDPANRRTAPLLDAIIMPTSRRLDEPRSGVGLAAELAAELGRSGETPPVVLLCSGAARSEHLPRKLFKGIKVLAIDMPTGYTPMWPKMRTAEHILSRFKRSNDVGLKRNLGLVLARMYGWKNILLLDDDISRLQLPDGSVSSFFGLANFADALIALGERDTRAIGWVLDEFPDNSVVCHARGLAGLRQDKFIGGGALLVRCDGNLPFFPATYNEDWLFLLPFMLAETHAGALVEGGLVGQDPYPVYLTKRAASEELGDTLGEGLFNLLQLPRSLFLDHSLSYEYWRDAVAGRIAMMQTVVDRLGRGKADPKRAGEAGMAVKAVTAALKVHAAPEITNDDEIKDVSRALVTYCRAWQHDLRAWGEWLPGVDRGLPLSYLGLDNQAVWLNRH
jgi:hypothetical protein